MLLKIFTTGANSTGWTQLDFTVALYTFHSRTCKILYLNMSNAIIIGFSQVSELCNSALVNNRHDLYLKAFLRRKITPAGYIILTEK